MNIALCDDNIQDLNELEILLKKYKELHSNTHFEIESFLNPSILYKKIQENNLADIYILDILMSETTGIELGNIIRTHGNKNAIIYTTSSDDFALDAYHIHAVRYLLKPIQENQFFEAIDYALSYVEFKKVPIYSIKTKKGLISVPYSNIEYIENASRMLHLYQTDSSVITSIFIRKSFEDEVKELSDNSYFIKVHKSFIINMNYIQKLEGNSIIMRSGAIVPISKKNITFVKRQYLLFVSKQFT